MEVCSPGFSRPDFLPTLFKLAPAKAGTTNLPENRRVASAGRAGNISGALVCAESSQEGESSGLDGLMRSTKSFAIGHFNAASKLAKFAMNRFDQDRIGRAASR